jgi:predicted deacetylase|tara:strand:+ start:2032 stop:2784 length:753 start_codon:yes stop_codon:yes gene_type:complete
MFEAIKKHTCLLIRLDDIAENMNWNLMDKCELLFDDLEIKPLLGVIPFNKDPELLKYPKNSNFWNRVRSWQKKGWEISMHGFSHLYNQQTNKQDYFNYGGNSEFYGLDYKTQRGKIQTGIKKFKEEGLEVRSFFAPNHTYDLNTLKALESSGIKIVIDGYGLFPFFKHNLFFIPQLFYKEIMLPFGIQSTQIHLNYWKEFDYDNFKKFILKNQNKISSTDKILSLEKQNFFKTFVNLSVEKILKVLRTIR